MESRILMNTKDTKQASRIGGLAYLAVYGVISTIVWVCNCFSDMTLSNSLTPVLNIKWKIENGKFNMIIEKTRPGHAWVGFGEKMKSADVVLVERGADSEIIVKSCHLIGHKYPVWAQDQIYTVVESEAVGEGFRVEVERSTHIYTTPKSREILSSEMPIIYSYTDNSEVELHSGPNSSYGVFRLDLSTGYIKPNPWGDKFYPHEHIELILWTIVADFLVIVGKYMKFYKHWYDAHAWSFMVVLILSIAFRKGVLIGETSVSKQQLIDSKNAYGSEVLTLFDSNTSSHFFFAIILFFLTIIIIINGTILRFFISNETKLKIPFLTGVTSVRYIHTILGITTWVVARITVFFGLWMYSARFGANLMYCTIIETIAAIVIFVLLESYYRWSLRHPFVEVNKTVKTIPEGLDIDRLINDIRSKKSLHYLREEYPNRNIFIYLNRVYEIDYNHPGGNWIFKEARFREISRFLHGVTGLEESESKIWTHSKLAFKILEAGYIGDLHVGGVPDHLSNVLSNFEDKPKYSDEAWVLDKRTPISVSTSIFQFKNQNFKIRLDLLGVDWIGKHWMVSNENKTRLYTNCISESSEVSKYIENLHEAYGNLIVKKPYNMVPILPNSIYYLPLEIKKYDLTNALSKDIHENNEDLNYHIRGPIGEGLSLDRYFQGNVVIFTGGTGILPFTDLFMFLYKKAVYMALKQNELSTSIVQPKQDYEVLFKGARFFLYSAFRTLQDFNNWKTISYLYNVSKNNSLKLFDWAIRVNTSVSDEEFNLPITKEKFDSDFIKNQLGDIQVDKYLICGSPAMNRQLFEELTKAGVSKELIIFV